MGHPAPQPTVSPAEFVRNLRAAGVSLVVTYQLDTDQPQPPQRSLLEASGQAELVADDGQFALWRVKP